MRGGGFRPVVGVVPQPTTAPNFILSLNIEMEHLSVKWDLLTLGEGTEKLT